MSSDKNIRVGIIGTGIHGSRYANHIVNDIDGLILAGISRRSSEGITQAEKWNTKYFADWKDLVSNPEIDAIIAVTPPVLNLEVAKQCAAASKPLLIEKPLARNGEEAEEIVKLMEASNAPLTVGQTLRYNPVIKALKEQLPSMGKLHSFAINQRLEPSNLAWHDDQELAGSGVIIHTAVHIFDALRVITGLRIVRVMAAARCIHSKHLADLFTILAELEDGTLGTIDVSKVGQARSGRYEFVCEEGQLHADQIHSFTKRIKNNLVSSVDKIKQKPTISHLLTDWQLFLNDAVENPILGNDALYAVQVCDACVKSSKDNKWVNV